MTQAARGVARNFPSESALAASAKKGGRDPVCRAATGGLSTCSRKPGFRTRVGGLLEIGTQTANGPRGGGGAGTQARHWASAAVRLRRLRWRWRAAPACSAPPLPPPVAHPVGEEILRQSNALETAEVSAYIGGRLPKHRRLFAFLIAERVSSGPRERGLLYPEPVQGDEHVAATSGPARLCAALRSTA